jgi:hypothetical protein
VALQHKRMADNDIPTTVGGRVALIIQECKYPTYDAFAKAVHERTQNVHNWINRNSYGRGGIKIRAATGVDLNWLATGEGAPFPDGPKLYKPPKDDPRSAALITNQLENDVDAMRYLLAGMTTAFAVMRPDEGAKIASAIRDPRAGVPKKFLKNGFLKLMLDRLDAGAKKAKIRRA